jgi:hypothetical protein
MQHAQTAPCALAARARAPLRGTPLSCAPPAARRCAARTPPPPCRNGLFDSIFGKKPAEGGGKPVKPGKPGMKPIAGNCSKCANKGGVTCAGCKGAGRNKANGNPFERFKCYDCQARARSAAQPGCERACADTASAIRGAAFAADARRMRTALPQGFGLVPCKACGRGGRGLTPEQTGER